MEKLLRFGKLLLVSRRYKTVRTSLVYLFSNFLLISAIVFALTLILILMGLNNIRLPLTAEAWTLISRLIL